MQGTSRNFAVARTDRKWHLDLQFLVPKNAFDEEELADSLGLPPWDEIEGLLHYGRGARVRIGTRARNYDRVYVQAHFKKDLTTPAFRRFLKQAWKAHRQM